MKKVNIKCLDYRVINLTPRSKKIKDIEFIFEIDGILYKDVYNDIHKESSLYIFLPFTTHTLRNNNIDYFIIECFQNLCYADQIEELDDIIKTICKSGVEVGKYGNTLIDLRFEKIFMDAAKSKEEIELTIYEMDDTIYRIGNETYTLYDEASYLPNSVFNSNLVINELSTKSKEVINHYRNDFRKQKLINLNNLNN